MKELAEEIQKHRKLYYEGTPEITDEEFDGLVERLRELDSENEVLKEVGAPIESDKKIEHSRIMGSLAVVNNEEGWLKWSSNEYFIAEPKLDGLTIVLKYVKGNLVHGATRGNGKVGELITFAHRMHGVPNKLRAAVDVEVRGEGVVRKEDAEKLGAANPRNLAVGLTKRKDGNGIELIHFIPFQLVNGNEFETEIDEVNKLKELGFPEVIETYLCTRTGASEIFKKFEENRAGANYDMDGVVFKHNSKKIQKELGESGSDPRWAIAWKYKSEKAKTRVVEITHKAGKTGRIVPVLKINPVKLAGAVCVNVTANNYGFIRDNKIGIGTQIILERAGDVIPHIVEVTEAKGDVIIPDRCPCCNHELRWDGPNLICDNINCSQRKLAIIQNWIWGMDIEWFGPAAQKELFFNNFITDISDIYEISEMAYIEVIGSAMGKKIYKSIQDKAKCEWWRFLMSLGVQHLGSTVSKELAKRWKTIDEIIENLVGTEIQGMGIIKQRIVDELKIRREEILRILKHMQIQVEKKIETTRKLSGTFCITGTLSKPRKEIQELITKNGGKVLGGVCKGLNYLVVGEAPGSKLSKAQVLGIKIIKEQDLLEIIN